MFLLQSEHYKAKDGPMAISQHRAELWMLGVKLNDSRKARHVDANLEDDFNKHTKTET